jgi:glycosyltransferase involved in cell wall biosynthesis
VAGFDGSIRAPGVRECGRDRRRRTPVRLQRGTLANPRQNMTPTSFEMQRSFRGEERPLRVGVVCDYAEERWPSMDLFGELHTQHLREYGSRRLEVTQICPPFRRGLTKLKTLGGNRDAFAIDRAVNRLWLYPRFVRRQYRRFDVFHLMDHSYSQLVHSAPAGRTVVTCHDLDTFRCLLEPEREKRSLPFRLMTARILDGFKRAALVVCVSRWTFQQVLRHRLVPPERLTIVPLGAAPEFNPCPDAAADTESARLLDLNGVARAKYLLHVGSVVPRKRIDVLLKTFAIVKSQMPWLHLVRVGGEFDESQQKLLADLSISDAIAVVPMVSRRVLASLYRAAAALILPSEREGYGLPMVEAMACGTPVIASDLTVLREIGEDAAQYCDVGDCESWSNAVLRVLHEDRARSPQAAARRSRGIRLASRRSPERYAERMLDIYRALGS